MVRNIDLCADFLCGDKRLFHIHIAEPAVNADKGDVRLIFNDTEQLVFFDLSVIRVGLKHSFNISPKESRVFLAEKSYILLKVCNVRYLNSRVIHYKSGV